MRVQVHKKQLTSTEKKLINGEDKTMNLNGFEPGKYIKSSQMNASLHQLSMGLAAFLTAIEADVDLTSDETAIDNIATIIENALKAMKVDAAEHADSADAALKLAVDAQAGDATHPVWFSNDGLPIPCTNKYAGATAVTVNDVDKSGEDVSFYAPVSSGSNGQILKSNGSGAPSWISQMTQYSVSHNASTTPSTNCVYYYNNYLDPNTKKGSNTDTPDTANWVMTDIVQSVRDDCETVYENSTKFNVHRGTILLKSNYITAGDVWLRLVFPASETVHSVVITPLRSTSKNLSGAGNTIPFEVAFKNNIVYFGKDTQDEFIGLSYTIVTK